MGMSCTPCLAPLIGLGESNQHFLGVFLEILLRVCGLSLFISDLAAVCLHGAV